MQAATRHYLTAYLEPLAPFLELPDVTDVFVNRPGEVWTEKSGGVVEKHAVAELTGEVLARLARQIASFSAQGISREQPLLAGSLPDGARVQIAIPPATRGEIAIAIRKHVSPHLSLSAYISDRPTSTAIVPSDDNANFVHLGCGNAAIELLFAAVRQKRTILVSGGTSTGKTTFLNALLREVPQSERLVLIEDTPELAITHANAVGLIAARGAMGEARVEMEDLLVASLRLRPDRIIVGEIRGREAMTFLRAANSGHPGSMSSIHANSPRRAIDQLAHLVLQSGNQMAWDSIVSYIERSLDIIVQLERVAGERRIAGVIARSDSVSLPADISNGLAL